MFSALNTLCRWLTRLVIRYTIVGDMERIIDEDIFGAEVRLGDNRDHLQKARRYFHDAEGVDISWYAFVYDTESTPLDDLTEDALDVRECSVCGKELYRTVSRSRYSDTEDGALMLEQKRHHRFYDTSGASYYTCFKLGLCFKRVGYAPESGAINDDDLHVPRNVTEFFNEIDEDVHDGAFLLSLDEEYDEIVRPFVNRWQPRMINKPNVLQFLCEFQRVQNVCDLYFNGNEVTGLSPTAAINQVLRAIGVPPGKEP